jgi:hypothetical protein
MHADGHMPDWAIGAALVAGFVAMLLFDHMQRGLAGVGHVHLHANGHRDHTHRDDELEGGRVGLDVGVKV